MKQSILALLLSVIPVLAFSVPAYRKPNVDFRLAASYNLEPFSLFSSSSAYRERKSVLELPEITTPNQFDTYEELLEVYKYIRDLRFIEHNQNLRRSSWMYPVDGCWVRAEVATRKLQSVQELSLNKVFVFGNLKVKTPYSYDGEVTWWYHVAPLVKAANDLYVLDPSIEATRPLKLQEWFQRQSENPETLESSICSSITFEPGDPCSDSLSDPLVPSSEELVTFLQSRFLDEEKTLLDDLGFDSQKYLGDSPPWLSQAQE